MKKVTILVLLGILIFPVAFAAGEYTPRFKVIYQGFESTNSDLSAIDKLVIEFNLRIDRVGIAAKLNGRSEKIEKISLSDGKRLEIYLKESLTFENEYTLELFGIKEIYSGTSPEKTKFTFKMNDLFVLEKKIIAESREIRTILKNNSSEDKTVTLVISAYEKQSNKLLALKLITKNVPKSGKTEFSHMFSNLRECDISMFGFYNVRKLVPITY